MTNCYTTFAMGVEAQVAAESSAAARFVADRMLKRLARWLRLLGADVICDDRLSGAEALRLARAQGRPMLTRDKRLRMATDVFYLETQNFREQLREVITHFPFDPRRHAFSRCSVCNEPVKNVPREVVQWRVPPFVWASQESFAVCERCGRVYWGATHPERALGELRKLGL